MHSEFLVAISIVLLGVWTTQGPVCVAGREARAGEEGLAQNSSCPDTKGNQSHLNSFLWTIKRDPPSYFFGTIHVPYKRVWDYIPENTKEAFHRSELVYFELDLTDPYTISALANCQLLPQGEYLSNVIPRDIFRRLKRHLEYVKDVMPTWMTDDQRGRGLYADYLFNAITGNWERKRPIWVMLMVNSLTEADIKSRGIPVLDLYFAQEAERMGKKTGAVERVEEQCVPLNDLNFSQVVFALNQTLRQHEITRGSSPTMSYTTDDLIKHYNCGDLNAVLFSHDTAQVPNLVNSSLSPSQLHTAKQIDDYFRQELIYHRNQRMVDRIEELLSDNPNKSFFFAFGAGHFLGNNTVIDKLRENGHEIEHTPPTEELYLGDKFKKKRKRYPPLLADMPTNFPMPPVIINGNLEYLDPFYNRRRNSRHKLGRHKNRKNGRRRNNNNDNEESERPVPTDSDGLKRPQFNDLWVRLESTSFGPNSFIRRQSAANTITVQPSPVAVYAMYNSARGQHLPVFRLEITVLLAFLQALVLCR